MIHKALTVIVASAALGGLFGLAVTALSQVGDDPGAPDGETAMGGDYVGAPPGSGPAAQALRMNTYQGTRINPSAVRLSNPAVAQQVAAAFARLDPRPPLRIARFQWALTNKDLNVVGWHGYISGLTPVQGGWLAEIRVSPHFERAGGVTMTPDRCIERWLYSGGNLRFVSFDPGQPKAGALFVD